MMLIFAILAITLVGYALLNPIQIYGEVSHGQKGRLWVRFYPFNFYRVRSLKSGSLTKTKRKTLKHRISYTSVGRDELWIFSTLVLGFLKLATAIFRAKKHSLVITLRGGAGSPDVTAAICGLLESIRPILGQRVRIHYHPDYFAERLEGQVRVKATLYLYIIAFYLVQFLISLPVFRLARISFKFKKGAYYASTT